MKRKRSGSFWTYGFSLALFICLSILFTLYYVYFKSHKDLVSRSLILQLSTSSNNIRETLEGICTNVDHAFEEDELTQIRNKLELIPYLVVNDDIENEESPPEDKTPQSEPEKSSEVSEKGVEETAIIQKYKPTLKILSKDGVATLEIGIDASGSEKRVMASRKLEDLLYPSLPKDIFKNFKGSILIANNNTGKVLVEAGTSLQLIKLPEGLSLSGLFGNKAESGKGIESHGIDRVQICDVEINNKRYKMFLRPFRLPEKIKMESKKGEGKAFCDLLLAGLVPRATFLSRALAISPTLALVILCALAIGLLGLPFLHLRCIGYREGLRFRDVFVAFVALMVGCSLAAMATIHIVTYKAERNVQKERLERIAESIQSRFQKEMEKLEDVLAKWAAVPGGGNKTDENRDFNFLKTNILEDTPFTYPLFEMLISMDSEGMQKRKWSIRNTNTSVIPVSDREYFKQALENRFNYFPGADSKSGLNEKGFVTGRFVESIRSKTTGEAYAMLSLRHMEKSGEIQGGPPQNPAVSVIEAKPLSLIDTVLPPGYQFAIIDSSGMVQFHSQTSRNIREKFYEELSSDLSIRAVAEAGVSGHTSIEYRFFPHNAYVTKFSGTPWTLIVFVKQQVLGHMNLETLTFTLALYGVYLFFFILAFIVVYFKGCRRAEAGEARRQWFWPDRGKLSRYRCMILISVGFIVLWFLGDGRYQTIMVGWCFLYPLILIGTMCFLLRKDPGESTPSWNRKEAERLKRTFGMMVSVFIAAIAVFPPITFYSAIHKEEAEIFTKYHQYGVAKQLQDRFKCYNERYKDVKMSKNREALTEVLYPKCCLHGPGNCLNKAMDVHSITEEGNRTSPEIIRESSEGFGLKAGGESNQLLVRFLRDWSPLPGYDEISSLTRQLAGPQNVERVRPGKEKEGSERGTMDGTPEEREYGIPVFRHKQTLMVMVMNGYRPGQTWWGGPSSNAGPDLMDLKIETPFEYHPGISLLRFLFLDQHGYPFQLAICAAIGILILMRMVQTLLRIVFLTDLNYPLSLNWKPLIAESDGSTDTRKVLPLESPLKQQLHLRFRLENSALIRPADGALEQPSNPMVIGLREIKSAVSVAHLIHQVRASHRNTVILEQFDYGLNETNVAIKKLELLEGISGLKNKMIVIRTFIDPLFFLVSLSNDFMLEKSDKEIPIARWAAVLQGFVKIRSESTHNDYGRLRAEFTHKLSGEKPENIDKDVWKSLIDEGWPNNSLNENVKHLLEMNVPEAFTPSDIVDQMRDLADGHYRRIWSTCSTDEKVLLFRLAQEGFVNWRMTNSLRSLMRRRLIVSGPNYRLMNESFRKFVLNAEPLSVFQEWQDAAGESLWDRIRFPILLVGTVVAVFFFATQQEVFSQSLKILAALTAGIPALIKLFGNLLPVKNSISSQD